MPAAKLMSGYIELTVKKSADAFKEITAEVTNVGRQADKVGKQSGESIGGGIAKGAADGAKRAGKSVGDELSKSAKRAGEDAGKQVGDALEKGATRGAKRTGRTVRDEITKGAKRAGDDVGKTKVEPKVVPKVDTKPARETIIKDVAGGILEAARQGAKDAGVDLDKWAIEQAGKLGGKLGQAIGDTGLRDWLKPIVEEGNQAADAWGRFRDAMLKIDSHKLDPLAGTLRGIAGTDLHPVATSMLDIVSSLNKAPDAAGKANGLAGALSKIGGTAGQLAAAAAAWKGIVDLSGDIAKIPGVAGATDWIQKAPAAAGAWVHDHLGLPSFHVDPELTKPGGMFAAPAGTPAVVPPIVPRADAPAAADVILNPAFQSQRDKDWSPGYAAGGIAGVTKAGKLFGPGTGTSDSIIGVGADGVPTARVSVGEGVIRKAAMDAGGDKIVAALNSGWVPRFDEGGVVPPTPNSPVPQIKVPEATSGAAGNFNQWLQTQQGKPYQYGTMYDCSGFMSQVYNQLTGKQLPRFNTESDLAAYGFVRGSKAATFQLGIHHGGGGPNSHMAGTLPDGRNVESAGNGVQIGAGAHGAFDPQFEDRWFLPGSENFLGGTAGPPPQGSPAGLPAGPLRTQGFIPAAAGASGKAGTSFASGLYQMGASAINGLIDQAASAASTAITMGAMAGSFGAGGQAAGAASQFAIGMVTQAAKRGIQYTAQMAGIGTDALAEILMPFGVPRFFNTDVTQFAPQLPGMPAAVTTGEKAQQAEQGNGQAQPGGPVQPGQLPGQQPIGSPLQFAQPQGITPTASPIVGPPGPPPTNVARIKPPPGPIVPGMGQPTQGVGAPVVPAPSGSFLDSWLPNLIGHRNGGVVGVYDNGGWLPPGATAINMSNRPEPILSSQQWADVREIAGRPAPIPDPKAVGGVNDYSVRIDQVTVKDVNELQREIDSRQRLNSMRHRGRP